MIGFICYVISLAINYLVMCDTSETYISRLDDL